MQFSLVPISRWRYLHGHQMTDGATCISYKFGHQMAPLALVAKLATRIAIGIISYGVVIFISQSHISLVCKGLPVRDNRTHILDPRDTWVRKKLVKKVLTLSFEILGTILKKSGELGPRVVWDKTVRVLSG